MVHDGMDLTDVRKLEVVFVAHESVGSQLDVLLNAVGGFFLTERHISVSHQPYI